MKINNRQNRIEDKRKIQHHEKSNPMKKRLKKCVIWKLWAK